MFIYSCVLIIFIKETGDGTFLAGIVLILWLKRPSSMIKSVVFCVITMKLNGSFHDSWCLAINVSNKKKAEPLSTKIEHTVVVFARALQSFPSPYEYNQAAINTFIQKHLLLLMRLLLNYAHFFFHIQWLHSVYSMFMLVRFMNSNTYSRC